MATYKIELKRENIHGILSKSIPPVLRIKSGDSVIFQTLEGDWRWDKPSEPSSTSGNPFVQRKMPYDQGHALCGPVYVEGAKPGMTLKVHVDYVIPHTWGWSRVGLGNEDHLKRIDYDGIEHFLLWDLDVKNGKCTSNMGHQVDMIPFMGVMTVATDSDSPVRTHLPGIHGGNLDCKEVVSGSTLYLPVYTEGALFSTGDGHARQGDGELACTAIECPIQAAKMTFEIVNKPFEFLACDSPNGWITFGFNEELTEASYEALHNMIYLMQKIYNFEFKEALNLCGAVVDMHVTQIVNGIRGAHAILPHCAILDEKEKK